MADSQKMKITRRAYELWQQAGEPKDRDEEFYLQAERELNDAPENAITATIPPAQMRDEVRRDRPERDALLIKANGRATAKIE